MSRPLVTAAEIREMDRRTIEDLGIPGVVLMENAGRGTTDLVRREHAAAGHPGPVAILCGSGNNGGDGYVVARHLHQHGVPCVVYLATPPDKVGGDARVNLEVLRQLPVPIERVASEDEARALSPELARASVIVDALLGTGLRSEVRGVYRALLEVANASVRARKVAVDIPSGLRADDGAVLGLAFRADVTATFAAAKLGLYLHPGAAHAGEVAVIDIGIPPQVVHAVGPRAELITRREVAAALGPLPAAGHKGTFGHCLVVAGAPGKGGAALLTGEAALRGGAGLVTVATDRRVRARLEGRVPSLMVEWIREDADRAPDETRLSELVAGKRAVVAGPGLGTTASTEALVRRLLQSSPCPLVLDADALNVLAPHAGLLAERKAGEVILTPHPGEMARLLGVTTREVESDRCAAARLLAARERAIVVLKGAHTLVTGPDGLLGLNPTGNPGLGTAGSGDVLAGLLGALLAAGMPALAAARVGVWLHGRAGDHAARRLGERSVTAQTVLEALASAILEASGCPVREEASPTVSRGEPRESEARRPRR